MFFSRTMVLLHFMVTGLTSAQDLCTSPNNVFTAKVDLFAGEMGYYQFEECGDQVNPTIGLEIGETYTFLQTDSTNYVHPFGFAYFPDGRGLGTLEPGSTPNENNFCTKNKTCPAPMYFLNDKYLGTYSNIPEVANVTVDLYDTGKSQYKPPFSLPMVEWYLYGNFSVQLRFTDADYKEDLFYYCLIHKYMTGRIKLLKNGVPVNSADTPALDFTYDQPGKFDQTCGTYGLDNYTLPQSFCPPTFVCDTDAAPDNMKSFSACIDAMNCHMFAGMTTNMASGSAPALFMHQMIPHHQNAVNMAKTLLHSGAIPCDDLTSDSEECTLFVMMRSIINGQNAQINVMRDLLNGNPDWTEKDDCVVELQKVKRSTVINSPNERKQRQMQEKICTSENNVFTVTVDYFVGRLGYYQFEECGDEVNPTIGININETYTFVQSNVTTYYHPLGFAYFPDGEMAGKAQLAPGVTQTEGNTCAEDLTCPAPMYFMAGTYLGNYSNNPEILPATTGQANYGLDEYVSKFFHALPEWLSYGEFSVKLRFTDADYKEDLFYFCEIHEFMSGRIKLMQDGVAVSSKDTPELGYEYDTVGTFDKTCGTYNLDPYVLPQDICPQQFVCNTDNLSPESQHVAVCFDAFNCAMLAGMTTNVKVEKSEKTFFMHQMIPHHENAVNMAKTMLYSNTLPCDDLTDHGDALCVLQGMMYEIINEQNYQIQVMQRLLESNGYNATESDDCVVKLTASDGGNGTGSTGGGSGSTGGGSGSTGGGSGGTGGGSGSTGGNSTKPATSGAQMSSSMQFLFAFVSLMLAVFV